MTIDHSSQSELSPYPWGRFLRPSHRTRPEQWVGFGILLCLGLAFDAINGWIAHLAFQSETTAAWIRDLAHTPGALSQPAFGISWTLYYLMLSVSAWALWRRFSLRVLKLEFSVFFVQFLFQTAWTVSLLSLQETRVALFFSVILWFSHLASTLLFWKKEPFSGQLLLLPFFWVFYAMGLNMFVCIANP
jgi:tryptophan-rich sensory protein